MFHFWFDYGWVMVMGFLVSISCGLLGIFLVYQRLSLLGDALSHSVLPGVVGAYVLLQKRSSWGMTIGAFIAAACVTYLIEWVSKTSRLRRDGVLAVCFSFFFACGILGVTIWANGVDLDLDCVLFGEIAFIGFQPGLSCGGVNVPYPIIHTLGLMGLEIVFLIFFYKQIWILTFDMDLARLVGVPVRYVQMIFMIMTILVIVNTFQNVGALLVGGMFVFPVVTARLWAITVWKLILSVCILSLIYTVGGVFLAIAWNVSIAAMMVCVAFGVFLLSFLMYRRWV